MKKAAILYSNYTPTIDAILSRLDGKVEVNCFDQIPNCIDEFDLVIDINYTGETEVNSIKIHHSLLPAFEGDEPLREAILTGVKVTGITVYYTKPFKIIAQYPVFITGDKHYDDLEQEISYLEQTIYPLVIEKVLNNEAFEIKTLLKSSGSCSGNCGGCSGCSH